MTPDPEDFDAKLARIKASLLRRVREREAMRAEQEKQRVLFKIVRWIGGQKR